MRTTLRINRQKTKIVSLLATILAYAIVDYVHADSRFQEMIIEPAFKPYLLAVPDFMEEGGARLIEIGGCTAIVGIGKVVLDGTEFGNPYEIYRKGEILARSSLLALIGPVAIATSRRVENEAIANKSGLSHTLSELFQTTTAEAYAHIERMPAIGAWRYAEKNIFHIAVGKILSECGLGLFEGRPNRHSVLNGAIIENNEPYTSLLDASPLLYRFGGVQGFALPEGERVILSVSHAIVHDSIANSIKIARLRAVRQLLAQREGLRVRSIRSLSDKEVMIEDPGGERWESISALSALDSEKVAGEIQAWPDVVVWQSCEMGIVGVAVGKKWVK